VADFPEIATNSWTDVVHRLTQLRQALAAGETVEDEAALLLLHALLRTQRLVQAAGKLPALKPATRTELLQRLLRARDLIDSNPAARPKLDELARHARLSRYHLLRSFVCAFGATPGNYAARRRIESAVHLLATTSLPIVEIAGRAGFESQSAFTRSFCRWRGLSPAKYRAALLS
jgi:AraC-like DNA-binding protein